MSLAAAAAIAFATVFEFVTDFVCGLNCRFDHIYGYGERHIVNGFVGNAGLFRNSGEHLVVDFIGAEVFQTYGQTDFFAEVENLVEFFLGAVFKHELANRSERDHLAVEIFRVSGKKRKSVVNCVRCRKSAALESETGEKNVGFNDFFKSGSYAVHIAGRFCFCAVGKERLIAEFRKSERSHSAITEHCAFRTVCTAGKTCVDVGAGFDVCARFEVRRESVAHTAYQETGGSVCDNSRVDEDYARTLSEICVIVKVMIVGIKHRRVGSGCVGRRDGGADDKIAACRDAFGCIDCLAAAETYRASAFVGFCKLLQRLDGTAGAFAFEDVAGDEFDAEFLLRRFEFVFNEIECERICDEQGFLAESSYKISEVEQFVLALDILGGAYKCFSHKVSPYNEFVFDEFIIKPIN